MMRVLVADKFEQSGRDGLQAIGCDVSYQPELKDDPLVQAITSSPFALPTARVTYKNGSRIAVHFPA